MFTGIVTDVGELAAREQTPDHLRLTIRSSLTGLTDGESIAVNGACLTVVEHDLGWFAVDVVETTRGRTALPELGEGDPVNLERALQVGDRLGGHWVQGHVDGVGQVTRVEQQDDARLVDIEVPEAVAACTIPHGSITVDGVSLTVNALNGDRVVQVSLIPFTLDHTTLGRLETGGRVQIEGDVLGKYVQRLLGPRG